MGIEEILCNIYSNDRISVLREILLSLLVIILGLVSLALVRVLSDPDDFLENAEETTENEADNERHTEASQQGRTRLIGAKGTQSEQGSTLLGTSAGSGFEEGLNHDRGSASQGVGNFQRSLHEELRPSLLNAGENVGNRSLTVDDALKKRGQSTLEGSLSSRGQPLEGVLGSQGQTFEGAIGGQDQSIDKTLSSRGQTFGALDSQEKTSFETLRSRAETLEEDVGTHGQSLDDALNSKG